MHNLNQIIVDYVYEDARFYEFAIKHKANMRGFRVVAAAKAIYELTVASAIILAAWAWIWLAWVAFG